MSQTGRIVFGHMDEVIYGTPADVDLAELVRRAGAKRDSRRWRSRCSLGLMGQLCSDGASFALPANQKTWGSMNMNNATGIPITLKWTHTLSAKFRAT